MATHLIVHGHGAGDPGAVGNGTNERHFTRKTLQPYIKKWADKSKHTFVFYDTTGNKDLYQETASPFYLPKNKINGGIIMTTVTQILTKAKAYLNVTTGSATHKAIIDKYNNVKPLPVGYKVSYTDDWCDAFISALAIETGAVDIIGRECGVQRHIDIFKQKGIWIEDGRITPKAGDIITFNWDDWSTANDGFADHIGIVESVANGQITTIEGNTDRAVKRRTYQVGNGFIRGYARPKYASESTTTTTKKSNDTIANEVIAGKWGVNPKRAQDLTKAGYNAKTIQNLVNQKLKGTASKKTNQQIADEIYRGLGGWGNGTTRISKLKAAGYEPNTIQKLLNKM